VNSVAPRIRRLPLLPTPCLDETFGSWLFRAAASYHTTVRDFAKAIMSLEHKSLPHSCDFDTQPPEALITALSKYSGYRRSELERLIVHPTGATLGPEHRDAYCPECMREDREQGIVYFRRAWLDAWTLTCERHHCLLGRFEPLEYRPTEALNLRNIFPRRPEAYRRNPSVVEVNLPSIQGDPGSPRSVCLAALAEMLKSLAGRDLLLVMGAEAANSVIYDLTGSARLWNAVWHGPDRAPRGPPELEHPLGAIELRVSSAYFATSMWQLFPRKQVAGVPNLLAASYATRALLKPVMSRWPYEDRRGFDE
jgi:TniQ